MKTARMSWWILVVALAMLVTSSMATCPSQCQCANKESEIVHQKFEIVFNCSGTGLTDTYITDSYKSKIIHLDLSSNQIPRVANDSFSSSALRSVEQILLDNNVISVIEEAAFYGLSELRRLSLKDNNITTIPEASFSTNKKLLFLKLNGNTHIQLPRNGFNVSSLVLLDLSRCGLKEIPPTFFDTMKRVEYVFLSFNSLKHVAPEALRTISGSIQYLNLFANNFTRLQPELLQILPISCKLYLDYNPFQCDFEFFKAYSVYKRRPFVTVLDCKTPVNMRRTWADELDAVFECFLSRIRFA